MTVLWVAANLADAPGIGGGGRVRPNLLQPRVQTLKQKKSDMYKPTFFFKKKIGWKKSSSFQYFFMKISQRSELVLIRSFPGIYQ